MNDSIKRMKGAEGTKGDKLVAAGVITVADMTSKSDDELLTMATELQGISFGKLVEWRNLPSYLGSCHHIVVDHRAASNLYQSRYGSSWEEEIKNTRFMKQYSCVRDLVKHIHDHLKETFKGTVHEDDWFFYHNALK